MKRLALAMLMAAAPALGDVCNTSLLTPRELVSHATDLGRAVGEPSGSLRITELLIGSTARVGDRLWIPSNDCSPVPEVGREYYVQHECSETTCFWWRTDPNQISGDVDDFVRNRHIVTRADVVAKLRAWRDYEIWTDDFRRWLASADYDDDDAPTSDSLTLAAIEEIETLVAASDAATSCHPESVGWLREFGSNTILARLAKLPPQQKFSEYRAWFDRQGNDDAPFDWNGTAVKQDIDAALDDDPVWKATKDCAKRQP